MPISAPSKPSVSHREEEIVQIITPIAVRVVENQFSSSEPAKKAELATELIVRFLDRMNGSQLDIPCDGPYCQICGLCAQ